MRRLSKLTGIVALLALCACASDRGGTAIGGATGGTTTGTTSGTVGGTDTGTTGTGTTGTTGTAGTPSATGNGQVDCSLVRCAACPTGQHPILRPPDCCRCVS
jgi:hypothetical protein